MGQAFPFFYALKSNDNICLSSVNISRDASLWTAAALRILRETSC